MKTIGGAKWKTAAIMRITALTMTPALAAAVWLYGIGVLLQVAVAVVAAVLAELLCLHFDYLRALQTFAQRRHHLAARMANAIVWYGLLCATTPPGTGNKSI